MRQKLETSIQAVWLLLAELPQPTFAWVADTQLNMEMMGNLRKTVVKNTNIRAPLRSRPPRQEAVRLLTHI